MSDQSTNGTDRLKGGRFRCPKCGPGHHREVEQGIQCARCGWITVDYPIEKGVHFDYEEHRVTRPLTTETDR